MQFLVDAQLPPALARWLTERGHPSEHVFDVGLQRAADRENLGLREARESVIVTKDDDFVTLHLMKPEGPPLLWIRLGNVRRAALLSAFEPLLEAVVAAFGRGETLVELT